jgi:hypothetical protein
MVRIALPADIEEPLSKEAQKRGISPEELALHALRATFVSPPKEKQEGSLLDFLAGYIGTVEGSSENLSEDTGRLFSEGLWERRHQESL